jgi:hypothetical protein
MRSDAKTMTSMTNKYTIVYKNLTFDDADIITYATDFLVDYFLISVKIFWDLD